jgi:hypothetical protein
MTHRSWFIKEVTGARAQLEDGESGSTYNNGAKFPSNNPETIPSVCLSVHADTGT